MVKSWSIFTYIGLDYFTTIQAITCRLLQTEAQGDSLESYYNKVPEMLKGLVELVYDLNNHPSIRLIESLLYFSLYY